MKAVLFDLGGVFLDWDPRYLYTKLFGEDVEGMEHFLTDICTTEWHLQMDAGRPISLCCQELAALHPEYADLIIAWGERAEEMTRGIFQGTVDLLAELKAAGVPCYALSNMEIEGYERRLDLYPFMKWFDGAFVSGYEGITKPDPRFYLLALERLGLSTDEVVFTDDRLVNVEAAAKLGILAIWFHSAEELRLRLVDLGLLPALAAPGGPGGG